MKYVCVCWGGRRAMERKGKESAHQEEGERMGGGGEEQKGREREGRDLKKRSTEMRNNKKKRERKRTERKEIKINGEKEGEFVHTCVFAGQNLHKGSVGSQAPGQHSKAPHLFKPPGGRRKFNTAVGSSPFFQYHNKPFAYKPYNLTGPVPCMQSVR